MLYDNKFQYLIIDKHSNIIYGTYDKNKFIKKLELLKVGLSFSAYDYNMTIKWLKTSTIKESIYMKWIIKTLKTAKKCILIILLSIRNARKISYNKSFEK